MGVFWKKATRSLPVIMSNSKIITSPNCFQPIGGDVLLRYGRCRDGVYTRARQDSESAACLLSFGSFDEWAFQKHVWARHRLPTFVYAGSSGNDYLFHGLLLAYKNPFSVFKILKRLLKFIGYKISFRGYCSYVRLHVREES